MQSLIGGLHCGYVHSRNERLEDFLVRWSTSWRSTSFRREQKLSSSLAFCRALRLSLFKHHRQLKHARYRLVPAEYIRFASWCGQKDRCKKAALIASSGLIRSSGLFPANRAGLTGRRNPRHTPRQLEPGSYIPSIVLHNNTTPISSATSRSLPARCLFVAAGSDIAV
jgi:hypothetical protein